MNFAAAMLCWIIIAGFQLGAPHEVGARTDQSVVRAGAEGEAASQIAYFSPTGKWPIVIVLSGATGTRMYETFASALAKEGFYVLLLDGNEVRRSPAGEAKLRAVIEVAQKSAHVVAGKVAVIGFSLGGGMALQRAANLPESVSLVVTYYPTTSFVTNPADLARRFRVPVLMLAGERDRYRNCCLIETARAIEAAAKERNADFTLVIYPNAEHGFNLIDAGKAYRGADDNDAWEHTLEMIRRHHRS